MFPPLRRVRGADPEPELKSEPEPKPEPEPDYKTLSSHIVSVERLLNSTATTTDLLILRRIDHWPSVFNSPAFPKRRIGDLVNRLKSIGLHHAADIAKRYLQDNNSHANEKSEEETVIDLFLERFNISREDIVPSGNTEEDKARKSLMDERAKAKFKQLNNGLLPRG